MERYRTTDQNEATQRLNELFAGKVVKEIICKGNNVSMFFEGGNALFVRMDEKSVYSISPLQEGMKLELGEAR